MPNLRFLSRLNPFNAPPTARWRNLLYLCGIAALPRLGVGAIRVFENRPGRKDIRQNETDFQKFDHVAERVNVELGGTLAYLTAIHAAMDGYANTAEAKWLSPDKAFDFSNIKGLKDNKAAQNALKEALTQHFSGKGKEGLEYSGVLIRDMFDSKVHAMTGNLIEGSAKHQEIETVLKKALEPFKLSSIDTVVKNSIENTVVPFAKKLRRNGTLTYLSGILAGMVVGGPIIQLWNDRVFSPHIVPKLAQLFNVEHTTNTHKPNPVYSSINHLAERPVAELGKYHPPKVAFTSQPYGHPYQHLALSYKQPTPAYYPTNLAL